MDAHIAPLLDGHPLSKVGHLRERRNLEHDAAREEDEQSEAASSREEVVGEGLEGRHLHLKEEVDGAHGGGDHEL
jgi:hypothetical protein